MITPAQTRAVRGLIKSQGELARAAGVGVSTIAHSPIWNNLNAIQRALEAAGIEFIDGGLDEKLKPLVDYVFEKTKMPNPFLGNTLRNVLNDILEDIDYDA